jgi:Tol biopolymer transport system component
VWSPDGRWIAYVSGGLWIVHPDGTGRRRLADAPAAVAPSFSPGGRELLFTVDTASSAAVEWWAARPADGTVRKLADRPVSPDSALCPPQWSPDGKRLAALRIDAMPDGTRRRVFLTTAPDGTGERVEFAVPEANTGDQPCDFSWQRRPR